MKKTVYYGGMIPNILGGGNRKKKKKRGEHRWYTYTMYIKFTGMLCHSFLWENIKICIALYKYQKLKHVRSVQFDLSHFVWLKWHHIKMVQDLFLATPESVCEPFQGVVNVTLKPAADRMKAVRFQCGAGNKPGFAAFSAPHMWTEGSDCGPTADIFVLTN